MLRLIHYALCPFSRSIRLALGECALIVELEEERPWAWRRDFLQLNPAGTLPVLVERQGFVISGAYAISEFLAETHPKPNGNGEARSRDVLFPGSAGDRAEIRRLVDWFHGKLDAEVSHYLLEEKVYQRFADFGRRTPDPELIRAGRSYLRYHLSYICHLVERRKWLAGDALSFADLAAGGHFSVLDYLGEVPWEEFPQAKQWYALLKSRPSFRPLLTDRLPGLPPPRLYAELDF
jgi:glutathione S-transferase